MVLLDEVDVLGDATLVNTMGLVSLGAVGLGAVALLAWLGLGGAAGEIGWQWWLGGAVATVAAFALHELVHGVAFKILGPRSTRVSFGVGPGILYTRATDATMAPGRFMAVLLAPTVIVTALIALGGWWAGAPVVALVVGTLHLSGCSGDLAMAARIGRTPGVVACEDTDNGCILWGR